MWVARFSPSPSLGVCTVVGSSWLSYLVLVSQVSSLSYQQAASAVGEKHALVGIKDDGVGALDPGESALALMAQDEGAAVGAVDVEPQAVLVRDRADADEVVDDAGVGRAARGDDGDDRLGVRIGGERSAQRERSAASSALFALPRERAWRDNSAHSRASGLASEF